MELETTVSRLKAEIQELDQSLELMERENETQGTLGPGRWVVEYRFGEVLTTTLFFPQTWPQSRHCRAFETPSIELSFSGPKLELCEDRRLGSEISHSGYRISSSACRT